MLHNLPLYLIQSILTGIYPNNFKTAKCVPIYKGTPLDPELPVNYRPISILNALNKTLERLLFDRLYKYLNKYSYIPDFQYGYRKQHNTSQAVLDFTHHVTQTLKDKYVSIAVFMDLSKAFDTVDINILEQKLHDLNLSNTSINLIKSYMNNRRFCFDNTGTHYSLCYGVPQGSILGPLLFITYIYDMNDITLYDKIIVYADDTTLVVSGRNLTEAKQRCNSILTRFYNYFTSNKLSLNPNKTKYMIFKPRVRSNKNKKKQLDFLNIDIMINATILEQVKSIKFLGVIINDNLTWGEHKQHTHRKICRAIGILYKCKGILNTYQLINMYKTFIQPYFLYAIEVWGHTLASNNDIMINIQNKVLRIIFNCSRTEDAWKHNNNRILNVKELFNRTIKRICFKHHSNLLPNYFSQNVMPLCNSTQTLQTTNCDNIKSTRSSIHNKYNYKNTLYTNTTPFKNSCITLWNELPLETKRIAYLDRNASIPKSFTIENPETC
ncbi:MAG: reverse transcriptase family protein [Saccharospirillaceae bacterium]|nr:reverse transcriptase family protein [Saccharospirillaceae bacterium]